MKCRDDDGKLVGAGGRITFSYGIPPRHVEARIVGVQNTLFVVPEWPHRPELIRLRNLRQYVGAWWKAEEADV